MKGLTRVVAIVAIVVSLQLAQASNALADGCLLGCEDPCDSCASTPEDITWE
jgi:hypothetical protein